MGQLPSLRPAHQGSAWERWGWWGRVPNCPACDLPTGLVAGRDEVWGNCPACSLPTQGAWERWGWWGGSPTAQHTGEALREGHPDVQPPLEASPREGGPHSTQNSGPTEQLWGLPWECAQVSAN